MLCGHLGYSSDVGVQPRDSGDKLKGLTLRGDRENGIGRQSLGRDLKAHEVIDGLAHARLRELLVGAEPKVVIKPAPDCGVVPASFNKGLDHGLKGALLVGKTASCQCKESGCLIK